MTDRTPYRQVTQHSFSADPRIGSVLGGRYRVIAALGRANLGTVYRAEQVRLQRPVAIKFLVPEIAESEESRERFRRDVEIMGELRHPHVVEILDYDTAENGTPYLVMEFIHGQTLRSWLDETRPRSNEEFVEILLQLAGAVGAAHDVEIVHRDLRPENVLLLNLGGRPFVKLTGFGLSKRNARESVEPGSPRLTGALAYLAPELTYEKPETVATAAAADQYSLGALAFEMFAGRPPFCADGDPTAQLRAIRETPVPSLRTFRDDAPTELDGPLQQALSKHPEERFPSVLDFIAALKESLGIESEKRISRKRSDFGELELEKPAIGQAPTIRGFSEAPLSSVQRASCRYGTSDLEFDFQLDLNKARAEIRRMQHVLATCYLRAVIERARNKSGAQVESALAEVSELAERIVFAFVLAKEARVKPVAPGRQISGLGQAEHYLLSRIDGPMDLGEILDVSPFGPAETWCTVATLLARGGLSRAS